MKIFTFFYRNLLQTSVPKGVRRNLPTRFAWSMPLRGKSGAPLGWIMRAVLVGFIATTSAYTEVSLAETLLTEKEQELLTGVYSYAGPFNGSQIEVIVEFSQDDTKELLGGGKYRAEDWPEGKWEALQFHSFQRLSASEWEQGWGVTEMAGLRCDSDRICIVAVDVDVDERGSNDAPESSFRLMQFSQDLSTFQSYTVPKKGESGYLGVTLKRLVGEQQPPAESSMADGVSNAPTQPSLEVLQLQMELAFWQSVERHGYLSMLHAYLAKYPDGVFSQLAKLRIEQLEKS
jgi:hypothetical protein